MASTSPYRTQTDLITEALANLGVLSAGQPPDIDDFNFVLEKLDSIRRKLAALEIVNVPDINNIPGAWFSDLADIVAGRKCATLRFGSTPDFYITLVNRGLWWCRQCASRRRHGGEETQDHDPRAADLRTVASGVFLMPTGNPMPIPFPLSSFPGANSQEGAGRLINTYAEPLGEAQNPTGATRNVWRRSAGLSQHATTTQTGYRGGLIVNNLSYETWANEAATVDINGTVILLGTFPGTQGVSIAVPPITTYRPPTWWGSTSITGLTFSIPGSARQRVDHEVTIAGSAFNAGDVVALQFVNPGVVGLPVTVIYTLSAGSSATVVAAGLTTLINGNVRN